LSVGCLRHGHILPEGTNGMAHHSPG
jgi:hypothetical protein